MSTEEARHLVAQLNLKPHPEGGYFVETFRSGIQVCTPATTRSAVTSIYYLLSEVNFSAFHSVRSDEIWHHYRGAPVAIEMIDGDGRHDQVIIGRANHWQAIITAGTWFAAHACVPDAYALVGCDVAPGFAFDDFELGTRDTLITAFPQHRAIVERWTRE
jgi:predicted cupin superfamily sugar epimerase